MTRDEQWLLDEKYGGNAEAPGFVADRARLARGAPLAYIIGWQPFLGLAIHLDSRPLIPRSETEWWTERLLEESSKSHPLRFLDLCAGSGAIGCAALARLPEAQVSFGEIDPAHEPTILKNIRENHLDASRAAVRIGNLFTPFAGETFDIIAANPPYIPESRILDASVREHEPHEALFAGDDGLAIIRRIAAGLRDHLAPRGAAWIEIDSDQGETTRALFEGAGFSATLRNDQFGRPRVIVVSSL